VPRLKISSISPKEKYFRYLHIYHLFARGRATSKHGGGGRYDAILEFKGLQIKKISKERKKERKKKYIYLYVRKRKNMSMCKNKNKVNSPIL
jgi:hypothetical protein